jgi:hypothetical protein
MTTRKFQNVKLHYVLLLILQASLCLKLMAQKGCTDPMASNYNPSAKQNDGSCLYANTTINPSVLVSKLSDTINETSGLAFHNGKWYTHNDGGNPNAIYQLNMVNGSIVSSKYIRNGINEDWEDLAFNDSFSFIGDFGNNNGNRKNLKVLKIANAAIDASLGIDTVQAEQIGFAFADQIDFTSRSNATPYDVEAMFVWQDSIHVFTKNWVSAYTKHYVMPCKPGNYLLQVRDSIATNFMVTGASIHPQSKSICLVGYNSSGSAFLMLLWDFAGNEIFSGNKRKINLGSFFNAGQIESIAFKDRSTLYATNEKNILSNRLMQIDIQSVLSPSQSAHLTPSKDQGFLIHPNPVSKQLHVTHIDASVARYTILNLQGQTVLEVGNNNVLDVSELPNGLYVIQCQAESSKQYQQLFLKTSTQ